MIQYFWEYQGKFSSFLQQNFPKTYKRKFSMTGEGIYNLILINDKIYDIKLTETKNMLEDNNKLTTDALKNKIINHILNNLKSDYTVNNGKITFHLGNFIAKIEIVKKMKMPT